MKAAVQGTGPYEWVSSKLSLVEWRGYWLKIQGRVWCCCLWVWVCQQKRKESNFKHNPREKQKDWLFGHRVCYMAQLWFSKQGNCPLLSYSFQGLKQQEHTVLKNVTDWHYPRLFLMKRSMQCFTPVEQTLRVTIKVKSHERKSLDCIQWMKYWSHGY